MENLVALSLQEAIGANATINVGFFKKNFILTERLRGEDLRWVEQGMLDEKTEENKKKPNWGQKKKEE